VLLKHWIRLALSLALASPGGKSDARMAMTATTTSNSVTEEAWGAV
jgi:hypothetical protein